MGSLNRSLQFIEGAWTMSAARFKETQRAIEELLEIQQLLILSWQNELAVCRQ